MEVLRKYKEKNPEVNVGKLFAVYDEESKGKVSVSAIFPPCGSLQTNLNAKM